MLVDLHANPGELSPEDFAEAVDNAGLDAVVITRTNRADGLDAYADALDAREIDGFFGVELALDKGMVVYVPSEPDADFSDADWTNEGRQWTIEALRERLDGAEGAVIASHPYCREEHPALGDRVYQLKPLTGVATRVGRGRVVWDRLADQAAIKRGLTAVATSGGSLAHLGAAATVFHDEIEDQAGLVTALAEKTCFTIEMDLKDAPKDRRPPAPSAPSDRGDGPRGRGRRDDDRRGGRGRRDDRRGGGGRGGRGGRGGHNRD